MAFNTPDLISVWYQGQAIPATQPFRPDAQGHIPGLSTCASLTIRRPRRRCSTASATRIATVTAGATCPDGSRSCCRWARRRVGRDRERDELWTKSMAAIGIRIEFVKQKWPDLLKMARAGQLQMWPVGWITTSGDGDAFMQLLYGPNMRGRSNSGAFAMPNTTSSIGQANACRTVPNGRGSTRRWTRSSPRTTHGSSAFTATRTPWCGRGCWATQAHLLRARVEVLRHRHRTRSQAKDIGRVERCARCDRRSAWGARLAVRQIAAAGAAA